MSVTREEIRNDTKASHSLSAANTQNSAKLFQVTKQFKHTLKAPEYLWSN